MAHDETRGRGESTDGTSGDDWGEETMRPWVNPPMRKGGSGAGRGSWRFIFGALVALGIFAIVLLVLVSQEVLSSGWAYYVALPIGGVCAVTGLVISVFKARIESKDA